MTLEKPKPFINTHVHFLYLKGACVSSPCANLGNCTEDSNGFTCACARGYGGNLCADIIDHCLATAPCQNGATCQSIPGDFQCDCAGGFIGRHCEVNVNVKYIFRSSEHCERNIACVCRYIIYLHYNLP